MTKEEMAAGFAKGLTLTQEEWCNLSEKQYLDELVAEGKATATRWEYKDNFQCVMRRATGTIYR